MRAKKKKSSEEDFIRLKLDKAGNKLFESPDFSVWVAYTRMVSKTDADAAILTSLTARYGDEALSKMIEGGLRVKSTQEISTKLQQMQFKYWKELGISSDDMFTYVLKLDEDINGLLKNPNLNTLAKYVDELSEADDKLKTPMIDTFRAYYSDAVLLKMFHTAKNDPKTQKMAESLIASLNDKLRLDRFKKAQLRDMRKAQLRNTIS
ncbi:unnamed protein product [Phytophthora lilii]|uniref:Unnamed protein product n=1 Tax=Phytophthora lilii TaxID=2077276 RepID=A0A9W6U9V3_9STRA|nr:unnamed protein product [Phytophthora lilii]